MTLIYVLPTPDLSTAVKVASDIYATTGMQPSVISDGADNFKFNSRDAALVMRDEMSDTDYDVKNRI